jgi:hypothetical protein
MTRRTKALARARSGPKGWTGAELASLLVTFGFERTAGSKHEHFVSPRDRSLFMTVTRSSGEIPSAYVRQAVSLIDAHCALALSEE